MDEMTGRRSGRLKARATSAVPSMSAEMDLDSLDGAYESDNEPLLKTPKPAQSRKRKKHADESFNPKTDEHRAKKVRGRRGILKQLTEMPLDILFEIFGQLNPIDVLHLARTTKALRDILMRRSAVSVWKRACANISGFPPCPEDLTEPQFVNLAFGKQCHFCLSSTGTQVISWEERVRTCLKCIDSHFTGSTYGHHYISGLPDKAIGCIPITRVSRPGRRPKLFFYRSDETVSRYKEEYSSLKDNAQAVIEWISAKEREHAALVEHVKLCEKWVSEQNEDRARELEVARNRRKDVIIEKLSQMGWGDEIAKGDNRQRLSEHNLVVQKKELTDRVWNNIKDQLVTFMEDLKVSRLRADHKAMLKKRQPLIKQIRNEYVATCSVNEVIPPAGDFYLFSLFRDVVENTPAEEEVTLETFHEAQNAIPELIAVWRAQTWGKLAGMITEAFATRKDDPHIDISQIDLNLATAVFRCAKYECMHTKPLFYPAVLMHACASEYQHTVVIDDDDEDLMDFCMTCRLVPWNAGKLITFWAAASKTAAELVEACGRDPKTTTAQEMDHANPIFECEYCRSDRRGRLMMTWRRALTHTHVSSAPEGLMMTLPDEETQGKVRLRMAEELNRKRAAPGDKSLCCVHCHHRDDSVSLKKHMADAHQKTNMTSSDVVPYIDADQTPDNYYLWTPVYV